MLAVANSELAILTILDLFLLLSFASLLHMFIYVLSTIIIDVSLPRDV